MRKRAGLSQIAASEKVGITQSLLSRAENGRALLSHDVLTQLAELYGASSEEWKELVEMAAVLAPGRMDSRLHMQRGNLARLHDRIFAIEQQSQLIRSYQPGAVLGVLQTRAYIEAVFTARGQRTTVEVSELVENRLRRNALMFADRERQWRLIQTVGALDWNVAGADIMCEQLDRMISVSYLPNVRLGIIPRKARVSFFAQHGFHLYDDDAAVIGTLTATALSDNRADLDEYARLFGELEEVAVYDEDLRTLLRQLAEEYRAS